MLDDARLPAQRLIDAMPFMSRVASPRVSASPTTSATTVCCPGRAAFLSGQYSHHHGQIYNDDGTRFATLIDHDDETDDAGYRTGIFGKYLSISKPSGTDAARLGPRRRITPGGYYDYDLWLDGELERHGSEPPTHSTDVIADHAIHFLHVFPAASRCTCS